MKDISERLVILETMFNDRWDNHDRRSEEMWGDLKTELKSLRDDTNNIFKKLSGLPCGAYKEHMKNLDEKFKLAFALFVPIILTIVGIVLRGGLRL